MMSYGLTTPCWNCKNWTDPEKPCQDSRKITQAIAEIHSSTDGSHQGAGSVILSCHKIHPIGMIFVDNEGGAGK